MDAERIIRWNVHDAGPKVEALIRCYYCGKIENVYRPFGTLRTFEGDKVPDSGPARCPTCHKNGARVFVPRD